jgi:hypothetical protein
MPDNPARPIDIGLPTDAAPKQNAMDFTFNPAGNAGVGLTITPGARGAGVKANPMSPASAAAIAQFINSFIPQVPATSQPAPKETKYQKQRREGLAKMEAKNKDAQAFGEEHGGVRHISEAFDNGQYGEKWYYNDGTTRRYAPDDNDNWAVTHENIQDIALPAPGGPGTYAYDLEQAKNSGIGYQQVEPNGSMTTWYKNGFINNERDGRQGVISDARLKRLALQVKNTKY